MILFCFVSFCRKIQNVAVTCIFMHDIESHKITERRYISLIFLLHIILTLYRLLGITNHDLLSEDYLDYDNWSNETEREARELRFNQEYKDVTKSSTGKNFGLYISCIFHTSQFSIFGTRNFL